MQKDFLCAYHHNEVVLNFCKCYNCLLPVCRICKKLHEEEHDLSGSSPEYQQYKCPRFRIKQVYNQIQIELNILKSHTNRLQDNLLEIQIVRKEQLHSLRQNIRIYREKIVNSFEVGLMELEEILLHKVAVEDQKFIEELINIDENILLIQKQIQNTRANLKAEDALKTIIEYYHTQTRQSLNSRLMKVENDSEILHRSKYMIESNKQLLENLKNLIVTSLSLKIIK